MTDRHHHRKLPLALLLGALAAAVFFGCDTIDEPEYANPLDPDNPASSDPFQLEATYANGWVKLEWVTPEGPAIDQIIIEFIEYAGSAANTTPLDTVDADVDEAYHGAPHGNTTNYYRLKAMDASSRVARTSHVVPASVLVPPILSLPDAPSGATSGVKIYTADQAVEVLAAVGEVAQIDTLEDFSTMPVVPIVNGVGRYDHIRLLKPRYVGDVLGSSRPLYVRAGVIGATDTAWSETASQTINQEFIHSLTKLGGGATVAEPFVNVVLGNAGRGVDSVRFANSAEGLATATWLPVAARYDSVPLLDTANEQALYAQLASSFGDLVDEDPLVLTADSLTTASVTPDLPSNGIVSGLLVKLELSAVATEMRVSTDVGFSDTDWQPYADELMVTLPDESGTQTIYTQFRNHWFQTMESLRTDLEVSASVLDLAFTNLADGMAVSGGDSMGVTGTVGPVPDGYTLTAVELNTGNGFVAVTEPDGGWDSPTATWTAPWRVPVKDADTPYLIGLHAEAEMGEGEDVIVRTGTRWVEVIISQLVLTLDDPEDGDEITTGEGVEVSIEGTATADLTAAPLDSVVVTAGDATLVATEDLAEWSLTWTPPVVEAATEVTITATVHAGDESQSESVVVTLLPPEEEEEEEEE